VGEGAVSAMGDAFHFGGGRGVVMREHHRRGRERVREREREYIVETGVYT